ncbi:MAG: cellulase family glycosylhydrolase [Deltaproteobacteria bacterium]|nr:cellulase family glycosylhydrolase [Deltaproteobacteria bacterium]
MMTRALGRTALLSAILLFSSCGGSSSEPTPRARWTDAEAEAWYASQAWLVGANFVPSTAINQLEMWQADTYDEATIDRELGWAAVLGFNTIRVFLHDLLWQEDSEAFLQRIDRFLAQADQHGISVMLVFFDGVWNPFPVAGPQPEPTPFVHNSQWVQSPGAEILGDFERHDELEPYVKGVVGRFRSDPRVLAWDLFNEPDNPNVLSYLDVELPAAMKDPAAEELLRKAFDWARSGDPMQPITAGVWQGQWADPETLSPINEMMLNESDIVSFHSYARASVVRNLVADLQQYGRPVLCTEYMARSVGSTFQTILPIFDEENIGAYNWGLVSGRTQTIHTWLSWVTMDPADADPWFHDIFHPNGTPYDPQETTLIQALTNR